MAENFTVGPQYPGVVFLGGTATQEVMFIGITTKPSGIYLEFAVPKTLYPDAVHAAALGWATIYESVAALPNVVGVAWAQVQRNGNLVPEVQITVGSTSGNSTGELDVLVSALGPKLNQPAINALHADLDATEAL